MPLDVLCCDAARKESGRHTTEKEYAIRSPDGTPPAVCHSEGGPQVTAHGASIESVELFNKSRLLGSLGEFHRQNTKRSIIEGHPGEEFGLS